MTALVAARGLTPAPARVSEIGSQWASFDQEALIALTGDHECAYTAITIGSSSSQSTATEIADREDNYTGVCVPVTCSALASGA